MNCDVAIVGAGPSGLSAARALGRKNVSVVVVDRKGSAGDINCGIMEMLSLQPNKIAVTNDKIYFKESDFELEQKRAVRTEIYGFAAFSPCLNSLAMVSKFPTNFSVDYKYWIEKLEKEALQGGARVFYRTEVTGLLSDKNKIAGIKCIDEKGKKFEIKARITIGADGIRSKVSRFSGFKKERWGIHRIIGCRIKNFDIGLTEPGRGFNPAYHNMYLGNRFVGPSTLGISAYLGENEVYIINVVQTNDIYEKSKLSPKDSLKKFTSFLKNHPQCSEAYRKAHGEKRFCFLLPVDSPIPKPFEKEGVFLIGDAAFTIETQWTGAMAVATEASKCIYNVFNDGKRAEEYFSEYENWWARFVKNAKRQFDFTTFMHSLDDNELDEFMGLFEEEIKLEHLAGTDDEFGTPNEFIIRVNERLSRVKPGEVKSQKINMVVKMIKGQMK